MRKILSLALLLCTLLALLCSCGTSEGIDGTYRATYYNGASTFVIEGEKISCVIEDHSNGNVFDENIGTITLADDDEDKSTVLYRVVWEDSERGTPVYRELYFDAKKKTITAPTNFDPTIFEKVK